MPGEAHVLTTDSGPDLLDRVHALLEAFWVDAPHVAPRDRMAVTTAVAELAANVVEHASAGAVVPVRLALTEADGAVTAVLEDHGVPMPEPASGADVDPLAETGRGLLMVRALVDEVAYERSGDVNRWRVVRSTRG